MIAYHQVNAKSVPNILAHGLKRTSRGAKGDDDLIYQTDQFLDERRPDDLRRHQLSRDDNIYAYIVIGHDVIDITDGTLVAVSDFINNSQQALLRLTIDPQRCFVSNLDLYDQLKAAIERRDPAHVLDNLAQSYWSAVVPLQDYRRTMFLRGEIMITYDIPSNSITVVKH